MSTSIKRIALVAVAALGLGVLSVAPSQATVQNLTLTVTDGTATLTKQDTTTAASIVVAGLLDGAAADTITVSVIEKSKPATATNIAPLLGYQETTTLASRVDDAAVFATQLSKYDSVTAGGVLALSSASAAYVGAKYTLQLKPVATGIVAGTYTYTVVAKPWTGGVEGAAVSKDVSIVVAAAAVAVPAAANAKAYLQAGSSPTFTSVAGDSVTTGSFVAGTVIGQIKVSNFTSADVAVADTITVSMTGSGYLNYSSTTGRSFVIANVTDATISLVADGTSGDAKVTITTVAGASFTKSATFFDTKPTKVVATAAKAYIKAGTSSVSDVFSVVVTDSLGQAVTNATITAAATDTATTVGGAATCGAYNTTDKVYYCAVAGKATDKFGPVAYTIKAEGTDTAKTVVSTSATVTFSDNVATKAVLGTDGSALPGSTVSYTLTLTDKNGYPVADQTYGVNSAGGVLFASAVTSGWSTAPFATTDSFTSVSGVITSKGVVPLAGTATGTWTLVGDGVSTLAANAIDKTIGKTTVKVTTEVINPGVDAATDAANDALDAANAATDAANTAAEAADAATTAAQEASDAVAALSESVTKLIAGLQAQIKSLAAVVAKIAKKVKA